MAGLMSFVTSFFEKSQAEKEDIEDCENAEEEKFSETESDSNKKEGDNNSENSSDDQEDVGKVVCKFHLMGKCRFGEKCRNIHEDNQNHETTKQTSPNTRKNKKPMKNKEDVERESKKKPSMRTAEDVINRIKWDPMLPEDFFVVGYIDRFLGIQEQSFTAFTWEDLASVDYDVLAIPQHRIQYFKYKTEKVWDKNERLDIVYGSTGSNININDFMEDVDRDIKEKRLAEMNDEDYDSDDSDDDVQVNHVMGPNLNITSDKVDSDHINNVHLIAEEDRSTHFIAIKITNPEIVENVCRVQEEIINHEEILQDCCMKKGLFHITVAMIRLEGHEGVENAKKMMHDLQPELQKILLDRSKNILTVKSLNNFGQRVVYGEVTPSHPEVLSRLVSCIKTGVHNAGEGVHLNDKFGFIPHLTLAKVSRPIARMRRSKYIDSSYYQQFMDAEFGEQIIDNLQLCVIDSSTRYDGFYSTLVNLKL